MTHNPQVPKYGKNDIFRQTGTLDNIQLPTSPSKGLWQTLTANYTPNIPSLTFQILLGSCLPSLNVTNLWPMRANKYLALI